MKRRRGNPEADIQRSIVRDLRLILQPPFILHHSANESGKADAKAQAILTGMGVHPGFADLALLGEDRRLLFLEVKTRTGIQSAAQIEFEDLVGVFGWPYEVVRSSAEAIDAVARHGFPTRIRGPL